jgi:nucleoside-diphosphate-sugar epimerase
VAAVIRSALVTGGTGYLGVRLVEALAADGTDVHVLTRPGSDTARLDALPIPPSLHHAAAGDDTLPAIVSAAHPDVVFHLAAHYVREHQAEDVVPLVMANVLLCAQLADALRQAGTGVLVNAGTYFEYFDTVQPGEGYRPVNLYAATKRACADVLAYYIDAGHFAALHLILFDVYGPGDWRERLPAALLRAQQNGVPLLLPGAATRVELTHVDDAVAALRHAGQLLIERPGDVAGERFAVRGDTAPTLQEVVAAFEQASQRPVPVARGAFEPAERHVTDPWRGPVLPGWAPRVDLEAGFRSMLDGAT